MNIDNNGNSIREHIMKILVFHFSNMRTKDKDFRRPEIIYVVSTADSLLSDFLYFSGTLPDCVRGRSGVVPCQQRPRQRDCAKDRASEDHASGDYASGFAPAKIGPAKITPAETAPAEIAPAKITATTPAGSRQQSTSPNTPKLQLEVR